MQGTRPADATGLPVKRRCSKKPDSVTLASVILASAAVAPAADPKAFHDRAGARNILGDVVERLLGVLDMIEGDPDLEENGDLEPSIGTCYQGVVDAELDTADDEPSLGSFDRMVDQTKSYRQTVGWNRSQDFEQDDCDREDGDQDEQCDDEGWLESGIGDEDGLAEQLGRYHGVVCY